MILKLGMQHQGRKIYKVCINGVSGLTLTFLTARSMGIQVYLTITLSLGSIEKDRVLSETVL